MSKYKPSDVVAIKREIAALQQQKEGLMDDIAGLLEEKLKAERSVGLVREVYARVEGSFAAKTNTLTQTIKTAETNRDTIQDEVTDKSRMLTVLLEGVRKARDTKQEDPTVYHRNVLLLLQKAVGETASKKEATAAEVAQLQEQREALEESMKVLTAQKVQTIEQVETLLSGIHAGKKEHSQVLEELASCHVKLKAIAAREHDSKVLMLRLSEDYQRIYKQRAHVA